MIKAQTNNGAGPEILEARMDMEENAHACAVRATLVEHKEHLENVEVCVDQDMGFDSNVKFVLRKVAWMVVAL